MIKNNKGVTLVELLIVIVVMGIIAAFAIPSVGKIITNTKKDAIVADAIAVQSTADLYCASTTCTDAESLTWADLKDSLPGISGTYYEFDTTGSAADVLGDFVIASRTTATGPWTITLNAYVVTDYDFPGFVLTDDAQTNRGNVGP